jgi:hypothetical protein
MTYVLREGDLAADVAGAWSDWIAAAEAQGRYDVALRLREAYPACFSADGPIGRTPREARTVGGITSRWGSTCRRQLCRK